MKRKNKMGKYKPIIIGFILAVLFVAIDIWLADKEIVIRSPILVRQKIISPVVEEEIQKEWLKKKILEEIDKAIEERVEQEKNSSQTSLKPARAVFAKELIPAYSSARKWAKFYGVRYELLECIIENESHGNPLATGDDGKAVGVAQWHLPSWKFIREKMGETTADLRQDVDESVKTLAWAVKNGYKLWWTPVKDGRCR